LGTHFSFPDDVLTVAFQPGDTKILEYMTDTENSATHFDRLSALHSLTKVSSYPYIKQYVMIKYKLFNFILTLHGMKMDIATTIRVHPAPFEADCGACFCICYKAFHERKLREEFPRHEASE
jgi:hypothetical protein